MMIASERFLRIVNTVNERGFISTKELSENLDVTETTIRRDCEELEKQGLLIRVHGGAKSIEQKTILSNKDEKQMSERITNNKEKDLVCKKAASFIRDGHSTLIANGFNDFEAELFMIGGKYIPEYNMSVGPITLSDLEKFNFDYAFLSCAGIDIDRKLVYTAEMDTMAVKQKAMDLAVKKYLLIDSSKLSVKGFCSFISSDDFDAVICNKDAHMNIDDIPVNYILTNED